MSEICGFCHSEVPSAATVCAACGAQKGFVYSHGARGFTHIYGGHFREVGGSEVVSEGTFRWRLRKAVFGMLLLVGVGAYSIWASQPEPFYARSSKDIQGAIFGWALLAVGTWALLFRGLPGWIQLRRGPRWYR